MPPPKAPLVALGLPVPTIKHSLWSNERIRKGSMLVAVVIFILYFTPFQACSTPWSGMSREVHSMAPLSNIPAGVIVEKTPEPRQNNGLTDAVEWDSYSLFIQNQRVFIWSGEFHPWRLPVPKLWKDVLQKMKAAGLNTVSIYVHWGLVNPSPGVFDFEGFRSLQTLFDTAMDVGLWVILRPGPYINAETTAGGIPHWVTSEVGGRLRTNDTSYREAWTPYIREIARITKPNQVDFGGPVIAVQVDNEYIQLPGKAEMMRDVEEELRRGGITVPLTYNDAGPNGNYVEGLGAADLYGLDSYPQRFDCSHPTLWNPVVENYYDYHVHTNPKQPWFTPEFQGGAFDAWGPDAPGYDACRQLTDEHFVSVFYKNLYASNFKLINIYMMYGGTSWGHLPFPGVYTSYDYGAAISESRQIESPKYAETKRQTLFIRSTLEFYKTVVVGNSSVTSGAVRLLSASGSRPGAFITLLRNPDTGASFYIARHENSIATTNASFGMIINTSIGELRLPQTTKSLNIIGRESRIIVSDLTFGLRSRLLYSTAEVLWSGTLGDRDALVLYGRPDQQYEAIVKIGSELSTLAAGVSITATAASPGYSLVTIQPGVEGVITLFDTPNQIVIYVDTDTTTNLWFPPIESSNGSTSAFGSYVQFGTNATILVGGPHLVRRASFQNHDNSTLALEGDLKDDVRLILIGLPTSVRRLLWNNYPVEADLASTSLVSQLSRAKVEMNLSSQVNSLRAGRLDPPELNGWKYADSLLEISDDFRFDDWVLANHTSTNIPYKPYTNGTVLYGCDYGFCEGIVLWKGQFESTGAESALRLVINGGAGFAATVWLNDVYLGTSYGNSTNNRNIVSETNDTWSLGADAVRPGTNTVTIVQDNMGLEETGDNEDAETSKSPRGIRQASLVGGSFSSWRVQGKLGGYTAFRDQARGILNEGGSYGERKGWHLPEFDHSEWASRDISLGLPGNRAGLGFFVTEFDLDIPEGFDVPMSFVFEQESSTYRAIMFLNGWMMGKRVANLGPQYKFPVHKGILNYSGPNTIALLIWATEDGHPISPQLHVQVDGVYDVPI